MLDLFYDVWTLDSQFVVVYSIRVFNACQFSIAIGLKFKVDPTAAQADKQQG